MASVKQSAGKTENRCAGLYLAEGRVHSPPAIISADENLAQGAGNVCLKARPGIRRD
jgi:hypothetical protein